MKRSELKEQLRKLIMVGELLVPMTKTTVDDTLLAIAKASLENGQIDLILDLLGIRD
jgi:hypothetical protein